MQKVLVDQGGYAFQNVGDWAMLLITIERLAGLLPDAELLVFGEPRLVQQHLPGVTPLDSQSKLRLFGRWALFGRLSKWVGTNDSIFSGNRPAVACAVLKWKRRLLRRDTRATDEVYEALKSADLVISSGGGFLTDRFAEHASGTFGLLRAAQRLGVTTALLGQGIGPLKNASLQRLAEQTLPKLRLLGLREAGASRELVERLGVPDEVVRLTGDDAIELAYRERPVMLGDWLGLNIRIAAYADLNDIDVQRIRSAIGRVLERLQVKPLIVPIAIGPSGDEARTRSLIPECEVDESLPASDPIDVIRRAGACRLVITGSYHAGVFALSQGIPVIGLAASDYYRDKFNGLRGQFGTACVVVDPHSDDLDNELSEVAEQLWTNAEATRDATLAAAERQIDLSREVYRELAQLIAEAKA